MTRKKSSLGSSVGFFAATAIVIVAATGVGFWMVNRSETTSAKITGLSRPSKVVYHDQARKRIDIYIMKMVDDEPRLVPEAQTIRANIDPHQASIERLLATNRQIGQGQYLIPVGTKLFGVKVKNGVAYADFSHQLKDNLNGGSMNEALLVNAIIHTLAQFKDVEKVQILIEGEKIESLGGHLDISEPLEGDSTLLGEGETE